MEVNKLYKSVYNGVVVKCTSTGNYNLFGGVVVQADNSKFKVGYVGDSWLCEAFEEYAPAQTLAEGQIYDIPKGCKATIKNGKVSVEHSVDYKKKEWSDLTRYIMVKPGKNISIDMFGNEFVKITMDVNEDSYDCYDRSSKEEFMKNYNKALKALEL